MISPLSHSCSKCDRQLEVGMVPFEMFDDSGAAVGSQDVPLASCPDCELHHFFVNDGEPTILPMDLFWRAA